MKAEAASRAYYVEDKETLQVCPVGHMVLYHLTPLVAQHTLNSSVVDLVVKEYHARFLPSWAGGAHLLNKVLPVIKKISDVQTQYEELK